MTPELIFLAQALIILVLPVAIYRVFRLCGIVPVVVVQIPPSGWHSAGFVTGLHLSPRAPMQSLAR